MMQSGGRRVAAGFSLLEVVAVLLLIGILAVAAAVKYGKSGTRALTEADGLRSVLRYAQSRAMADVYTWGVSFTATSYALFPTIPARPGMRFPARAATRTRLRPA